MSSGRLLLLVTAEWVVLGACALSCSRPSSAPSPDPADSSVDAGHAYLADLSVVSTDSHAVTLTPGFSPAIHDYYVRCAAGTNAFEVKFSATPGATAKLTEPIASPARSQQGLQVDAREGDALVVVVDSGPTSEQYWVRCLPHDFPQLRWSRGPGPGTPSPGYYLIANIALPAGERGYAIVLDSNGVPVWYHAAPAGTPNYYDVETLLPGTISFVSSNYNVPYTFFQLSPWKVTPVGLLTEDDHHDMQVISSDRYLVFHMPTLTGVDLHDLSVPLEDGGIEHLGHSETIHGCYIYEMDRAGKVYWEWRAEDHLDPNKDTIYPEIADYEADGTPIIGVYHCNSLDIDPANGNILVSLRNLDSVMYIEKATHKILWKMGGSTYTKDGATYVPIQDAFHRQHDARLHSWKAGCDGRTGSGQISVFDDETGEPTVSRGVLYDVTVGGEPGECGASTPSKVTRAWEYKGTAPSDAFGSFRIQPDGARVIGWGDRAADPLSFTEVDEQGHDLLDLEIDPGTENTTYRAIKAPLSALDLSALRSTAGR
jgi:hypothetical protein